jgi:magnesium chelatase family protein
MLSKIYSATCVGVDAYRVEIEVDVGMGLPQFTIVGLPDQAVRESKERVRSALNNSGFKTPPRRITVNLAPADLKKEGPAFDLAIALGVLASLGFVNAKKLRPFIFVGELALDGSLREIRGALPIAQLARRKEMKLILPTDNQHEAALERDVRVWTADSLKTVVDAINGESELSRPKVQDVTTQPSATTDDATDFSDTKGQYQAKRAAEIAASGSHNLLLIGPPGAGKTMIARRIPSILPHLSPSEYLETAKIYSVSGLWRHRKTLSLERPFRAPHHTISQVGLVGGGSFPRPGEISLAHTGVLFLDEFPEFRRDAIEALRAPMEEGWILVSRAKMNLLFPSQFLTVASMNPCPCGHLGNPKRPCRCTMAQIQKYHQKISGPILDRIDLHVELAPIEYRDLTSEANEESSSEIKKRVLNARTIQSDRFRNSLGKTNALMTPRDIRKFCVLGQSSQNLLERAMKEVHLSARGYHKILKIARTIADLATTEAIQEPHIAEAIGYRVLDRNWFG